MNIREQYMKGNIFNIGDTVLFNPQEFTIKERGTNYLFLEDAFGNQTKKWLQDVKPMDKYTPKTTESDSTNTQLRRLKIKYKEEQEPDDDKDDEITDTDIDKMVSHVDSLEDIIDAYDDDELHIVDHEGNHVSDLKEELILEVLSRQERIRASIRFAQTAGKRERRMKIALHTRSSPKKINHRARVMAEKILKMRIIKKPLADLSLPEKERLEKILHSKKDIVRKLALKLAPKIKAIENKRLHPKRK